MADLPQKPNRVPYDGGASLQNSVNNLKKQASMVMQRELAGKSPEDKADALDSATAKVQDAQSEILASPEQQRSQIAEKRAAMIEERAQIEGRGLSTSDKIAAAILRAAPVIAASLTPGADLRGAQAGSQQINKQFSDEHEAQRKRELDAVDTRLGLVQDQENKLIKDQERDEDKAFQEKLLNKRFEQEKYLANLKLKGDDRKDKAAIEKYAQNKAKMFTNDALYKKSVSELAAFDKGFTALMNENANGYSDIAGMFNFIKGLDESVVRPSEIQLFNEARSLADRFTGFVKNKQTGEQFLKENRAKLAQIQGLLAKLPARYLNNMNSKAIQGEDDETATKINTYLKRPEDILSIKTNALLKKELEKERLQDEAEAGAAPKAPMTIEQKRAAVKVLMGSK